MDEYLKKFLSLLEEEKKEECVKFALSLLIEQKVDVITLYTKILEPALNGMECHLNEKAWCIWKEHVRSSIVRTIIECCYPTVLKSKMQVCKEGQKVIVICPDGEYHEIGARMAADFFNLCGFEAIFVGSSTPKDEFIAAIDFILPDYIAISVTNYFNLVAAFKTIEEIKKHNQSIKILVGGSAFTNDPIVFEKLHADALIVSYEDVFKIAKEGI